MTTERKLLYALGVLIIAGMIAVAAFSLGVYVGEQGWTLREPAVAGPGGDAGPQQPGIQGGQGVQGGAQPPPQGNLPAGPAVIGIVNQISKENMVLETQEGMRSVLLDEDTRLVKRVGEKEEPAPFAELQRGSRVAVFGEFGNGGQVVTAELIVILQPPK